MLTLKVPLTEEYFDNETQEFVAPQFVEVQLEHSLVSLSKWESKHEKPFLGPNEKTTEEVMSYVECMFMSYFLPPDILERLTPQNMTDINKYIDAKMTATWFNEPPNAPRSREIITSELIYYWMTSYQIPWEAQTWHLNRLFTLIKVFNHKNSKPKKMSRAEAMAQQRKLNDERRQKLGTNG